MVSSGATLEAVRSADQLESLVRRRIGSMVPDLRVVVRDKGVILQGHCTTYHAKQLAQHAAMDMGGLPILANDIEVR